MNFNINSNILFYSQHSNLSMNLIRILKNENLINFFVLICVDDKLDKLPRDLIVPSMKIKGTNKFWVAEETFEWIKQAKFARNIQQRQFINNVQQQQNSMQSYNKLEHGSKSDAFTFVDDKVGFFSQDYVGSKDKGTIILTPPSDNKDKLTEKQQKDLIKKIDELRTNQDTIFETTAKENMARMMAIKQVMEYNK